MESFYHALQIRHDKCIGCSRCMSVCPTEALRVREGKAILIKNNCVDCGKCYRVCPVKAIIVKHDDFDKIFDYRYRVALFPTLLLGQFPKDIKLRQIYSVLYDMGFTHVCEVENIVDILNDAIIDYIKKYTKTKPIISSFCPAIIRLIQVKFPALLKNIMLLKTPNDISAIYYKNKLMDEGIDEKDIGIFYITPCAAKIAAVKSPVGEEKSVVDGVINMDVIFNKIYTHIVHNDKFHRANKEIKRLSSKSLLWSLTAGEAGNIPGRCLAIDGIKNVTNILEKLEEGELEDVNFLELRACDEGCAGGILNPSNRFLTAERVRKIADRREKAPVCKECIEDLERHREHIMDNISIDNIPPRDILKLDEDLSKALLKMDEMHKIIASLPRIDCGVCGAPSCHALAEDIVRGRKNIEDCIFIQRKKEQNNELTPKQSLDILSKIWGKSKFK